uniref:hypothetical protein n=1 Tax=Paractinoplanes polyasparticus TaxID=2856853 RepID=UPI001C8613AA|nr:hypothetical protein [Actinoplanes polyasparticus]
MTDVDVHNDPFAGYEGRQEPDCTTCDDQRFVPDLTGETGTAQCPECDPTVEQVAAATAEYERAVATGKVDPAAEPF